MEYCSALYSEQEIKYPQCYKSVQLKMFRKNICVVTKCSFRTKGTTTTLWWLVIGAESAARKKLSRRAWPSNSFSRVALKLKNLISSLCHFFLLAMTLLSFLSCHPHDQVVQTVYHVTFLNENFLSAKCQDCKNTEKMLLNL